MTDSTSGQAGQGPDANPFSREGAAAPESSGAEQPGGEAGQSTQGNQGATALPPMDAPQTDAPPATGADPYGYQPPSAPDQAAYGSTGYGQPTPYSQPSANPYGQPTPYGQPSANPYGQPSANPPYGQASANPPYEQPPAYDAQPAYGAQPTYGASGYDQSGYGVSPYQGGYGYPAYGAAAVTHPQAVAALITGIVGVVFCPLSGFAGLVLGRKVRTEIDADPQRWSGRGMGTAGFILGIIGVAFTVLILLLLVIGLANN